MAWLDLNKITITKNRIWTYINQLIDNIQYVKDNPGSGGGDMTKAVYDTDDDGVVDVAEAIADGSNTISGETIGDAVDESHIHNNKNQLDLVSNGDHDVIVSGNPHLVNKSDIGLGNVDNVVQLPISYLDTDETLLANSDTKVTSQKAVKTYINNFVGYDNNISTGILMGNQESIGLTWTDLGQQGAEIQIRSFVYLGNGIVLAGTSPSGKIFRSVNYGLTWTDLGQQGAETYIFSLVYLGNGIVLAGTSTSGKIFRSVNYGLTWTDLGQQGAETYIFSLVYLGNGIVLAGTSTSGKIFRSVNYGLTWTDLGQQGAETYIFSFVYLGNGIVLAGTSTSGKIFRSS